MESESFGIEKDYGPKAIEWINEYAKKERIKFEARLYGYELETKNFGTFEMFSWIGDIKIARKLIVKASKRFKIKVIEGSYKTKEKIFHMQKSDYAMVRKGDKIIGHIELVASRFGRDTWKVKQEERK
jgi:hypothetical protein